MLEILRDYFLFLPAEIVGAIIFWLLQIGILTATIYALVIAYHWVSYQPQGLASVPYLGRPIVFVLAATLALYPAMIIYASQEHVAYAILNTLNDSD